MRPGDVIYYHGERHRITRVERRVGWSWPIACDDDGWAIALRQDLLPDDHDDGAGGDLRRALVPEI